MNKLVDETYIIILGLVVIYILLGAFVLETYEFRDSDFVIIVVFIFESVRYFARKDSQ
jgi:hypothetical protein